MSESEQYEMVTVASDGVTVDKRFEEDEFPVPAIAFEIQSSRSETVTVTLVDRCPRTWPSRTWGSIPSTAASTGR